jgi:hypothetical protein
MATSRGGAEVRRFMAALPGEIETKLLRGAARAAGKVIITEAKMRSISQEVDDALVMKVRRDVGRIVVKIYVEKGWARSVGTWLEYGTAPHFISVDDGQREGMSVARVNKKTKDGSLVIGGHFVGSTVHHPGARPHPFLRVSLDTKEGEAIAAAQTFINSRITRGGILGSVEPEGDDG